VAGYASECQPTPAPGGHPPEGTADEVLGYRAKGFKAVTIRVGGLDEPHFPQRSLERLRLADDDLPGLAEVRRRVPMPVATGESETKRFAFRDIVEQRAADFLQPDLAVVGGLTEARRIAALAAGCTARLGIGTAVGGPVCSRPRRRPTASSSSSARPTIRCCTTC
jgi:L-alanine-DL-glutamate epimerase-like enolase superfamily enzyme